MIGVDTSYLVGLVAIEHPAHRRCLELFEREILGRDGTMAISAQVLAEFCHVITDSRRFERPLSMSEAVELSEQWWHASECVPIVSDAEACTLFLAWMRDHRLGRKRVLDTLLAAAYYRAGVRRLASTNWRDFAAFGVFEIEHV